MADFEKIKGTVGKIMSGVKQGTPPSPSRPALSVPEKGRPAPAPVPAYRREFNSNPRAQGTNQRQQQFRQEQEAYEAMEQEREEKARILREKKAFAWREQLGLPPLNIQGRRPVENKKPESISTPESRAIFDAEFVKVQKEFPNLNLEKQMDIVEERKGKEIEAAKKKR